MRVWNVCERLQHLSVPRHHDAHLAAKRQHVIVGNYVHHGEIVTVIRTAEIHSVQRTLERRIIIRRRLYAGYYLLVAVVAARAAAGTKVGWVEMVHKEETVAHSVPSPVDVYISLCIITVAHKGVAVKAVVTRRTVIHGSSLVKFVLYDVKPLVTAVIVTPSHGYGIIITEIFPVRIWYKH